jgi:hypothetical protein
MSYGECTRGTQDHATTKYWHTIIMWVPHDLIHQPTIPTPTATSPPHRRDRGRVGPHGQPVQERTQPTPVMLHEVAVSLHDLKQILIVLVRHVDLLSPPIDSMLQVSCQAFSSQRTAYDTAYVGPSTAATRTPQRAYRSELKIRLIEC